MSQLHADIEAIITEVCETCGVEIVNGVPVDLGPTLADDIIDALEKSGYCIVLKHDQNLERRFP
jgi:hypothetical protein